MVAGYRLLEEQQSVYFANYFLHRHALICYLGSFDVDLSLINHHKLRALGASSLLVQLEFDLMDHFDCYSHLALKRQGSYDRLKLSPFGSGLPHRSQFQLNCVNSFLPAY